MRSSLNYRSCERRVLRASFLVCLSLPPLLPAQNVDGVVELDPFRVESFRRDYVAPVTDTGLGFAADPFDAPLTLVSIPADLLADQQVNNVEDALRNVAGVSKFKQGNGGEEKFSIRGFDASQSLYKDGARINNAFNATNIATTETANIERYDILKGPAAILYGQGEPGGVINYVTKKPRFDRPYRAAELIVGTDAYRRGELDLAGPLGAFAPSKPSSEPRFAYRLVSSYEDSGSHRDYTARDRLLLAPSLAWRPTRATTVTFQYEYITDTYTQDRGQVLEGNDLEGFRYSSRLAPEQFFGVPGWNENTESEFQRLGLLLEHHLSPDASLRLAASSSRVDKLLYDSSPRNAQPAAGVVSPAGDVVIRPGAQGGDGQSDNVTLHYVHGFAGGRVAGETLRHQVLLGVDWERLFNDGFNRTVVDAAGTPVNAIRYNVVDRTYTGLPTGGLRLGTRSRGVQTDTRQSGLVVQDLISWGDTWHLLAGLRYTDFDDRDAGVSNPDWSPRTGLVFRPRRDVSFYGSWAQGFTPTTSTGRNPATGTGVGGPVLDPETTEQFELGVRWASPADALVVNVAGFTLRKSGIVVADPASTALPPADQWSANLGETRTLGFDVQVVGRVTPTLRLIAGYAYLDNELRTVDPAFAGQEGNRLPGIPLHSGNLWSVYEWNRGRLAGLGFGLGAFAQSRIYASTQNRATYQGWVQLDALAYYKRANWKLQLNLKNLTDERFNLAQAGTTTDSFAAVRVGTSTPFSATASLAVEF